MNWKKVGQVILWILFWYYLLPHYLLKRYVFKGKNGGVWSSILSVVIAFFFLGLEVKLVMRMRRIVMPHLKFTM